MYKRNSVYLLYWHANMIHFNDVFKKNKNFAKKKMLLTRIAAVLT